MIDFLILARDWGKETGVSVSTAHLSNLMHQVGISHQVYYYKDDANLLDAINRIEASVIMLQAPAFHMDTLREIVRSGRETTLVVHSTISYLQAEGEAFNRVQDCLFLEAPNWSICNPCKYEVEGFSAYAPTPVFYLPNTFNLSSENVSNLDTTAIIQSISKRVSATPQCVSLFCEYRPFKNMTTQVTAVALASKKVDLELHLLEPEHLNGVYMCVKRLVENSSIKTVWHKFCSNTELQKKIGNMSVGMQVSYSETFSYILFEHMMQGIPTIGSTTVPYASLIPDFNDSVKIADSLCNILSKKEEYRLRAERAVGTAQRIKKENDKQALETLMELLRRSKNG